MKIRRKGVYHVYFHDEAPRLGSGWRLVQIVSQGRKWVRLRDASTTARATLPAAVWDGIVVEGRTLNHKGRPT